MELLGRHGEAVHAYLARRCGRDDADDLLSEVWVHAYEARAGYDGRWLDARPWLYGIAGTCCGPTGGAAPWLHGDSASSDPWPDVDARLDAAAQIPALRRALAGLRGDDRAVLLLVVWEGLAPAEVAIVLGIPAGTARSRLHRARTTLRPLSRDDPAFTADEFHYQEA